MALFSRRKKSTDAVSASSAPEEPIAAEEAPVEPAPDVSISVQAFRGVGAQAGPEVSMTEEGEPPAAPVASAQPAADEPRTLPLAPAQPPEQTETVKGMKDNVLLRNALAEMPEQPTNEQVLGVLRQALQSHLYLRVSGDARAQVAEGKPLAIAVVRQGDDAYMLAFSSAGTVRDSLQKETKSQASSAIAQPTTAVLQQVVDGGFAGIVIDNASTPHRAVFPAKIVERALAQADKEMTVKTLIAQPRDEQTPVKVGEALAKIGMWVAVNNNGEQVGVAEVQTADGRRFLQMFTHPLEIIALGRGDKPLKFTPEQLAKVFSGHSELAGVLIDPAGPSIIVERAHLEPVLALKTDEPAQ